MDNIDLTVTGGAFASVREQAWHGLGTVVDHPVSALELLQLAGCDFEIRRGVIRIDEIVPTEEGMPPVRYVAEDERNTAIYRVHPTTGEAQILGVASGSYPLWSPKDTMVGFADGMIHGVQIPAATAGALDSGRQVFMTLELPQELRVGGLADEKVKLFMVIHTSFDQSAITRAIITPIRVVCQNTLRMAIRSQLNGIEIKKTRNANIQAAQAEAAISLFPEYVAKLQERADALINTKVTDAQFAAIVTDLWGPGDDASKRQQESWDAKFAQIVSIYNNDDTQANIKGTAWGVVNAISERQDWFTSVGSKVAEDKADSVRLARSLGITDGRNIDKPKVDVLERMLALV
jgi:phage/plasmid-like protein (TIGR03299 family)